jgi:hypothetical protein
MKSPLGHKDINGRMILKLMETVCKVLTGFNWLRVRFNGGLL